MYMPEGALTLERLYSVLPKTAKSSPKLYTFWVGQNIRKFKKNKKPQLNLKTKKNCTLYVYVYL